MNLWPYIFEAYRQAGGALLSLPVLGCLVAMLYAVSSRR